MRMSTRVLAASVLLACTLGAGTSVAEEKPFGMETNHLNLVFSVNDAKKTHEFYGEILGLEKLPNKVMPESTYMIRYMAGSSMLKFLVMKADLPVKAGKSGDAVGIRLAAIILPDQQREGILKRLGENGYPVPKFVEGSGFRYGMVYDADGNQVEVVFVDNVDADLKIDAFQIGLTVSDDQAMRDFLGNVIGLPEQPTEDLGGGITKYSYKLGATTIKFWQLANDLPKAVGMTDEMIGMNLIHFDVPDVEVVEKIMIENGIKAQTAPMPADTETTIYIVEGPDGILFGFMGPMMERFMGE